MNRRVSLFAITLLGALALAGCKAKPAHAPVAPKAPVSPTSPPAAVAEKVEKPAPKQPETAKKVPHPAPKPTAPTKAPAVAKVPVAAMEHDPNATAEVKRLDLKGKAPDGAKVTGKYSSAVTWTDKLGLQTLVLGIRETKRGDAVSTLLVADYQSREGDGWSSDRTFKEWVRACQFDTTLTPFTGSWSVTDLNKDGLAEITFAYHVGCRSDVSPVTQKVLMFTSDGKGGTTKYALRGDTRVTGVGGAFKVDPAFKGAPAGFLAHAQKVWKRLVDEKM